MVTLALVVRVAAKVVVLVVVPGLVVGNQT
jgi:hypothetical protein